MQARKDGLFDVLDAMLSAGNVSSFAMLSQSERFQRKWPSLYASIEDGQLDSSWLRRFLGQQVPSTGICIFPLDGSPLSKHELESYARGNNAIVCKCLIQSIPTLLVGMLRF